jgi:hypothetical protein
MTEDFEIDGKIWINRTTYQKGENFQNKQHNIFATEIGDDSLTVIYGHLNYPTRWIFNYAPLNMYHVRLVAQTKEEAAKEAVGICLKTIEELKKGFEVEKTKTTT